jgi:hypothetical protein
MHRDTVEAAISALLICRRNRGAARTYHTHHQQFSEFKMYWFYGALWLSAVVGILVQFRAQRTVARPAPWIIAHMQRAQSPAEKQP